MSRNTYTCEMTTRVFSHDNGAEPGNNAGFSLME